MSSVAPAASATSTCAACGGTLRQVLRNLAGYEVLRCGVCETVAVAPFPTPEVMERFYDRRTRVHGAGADDLKVIARECMERRLQVARKITGRPIVDMIEVGCGPGFYLHGARELGLKVRGLDLDIAAVEFARTELGIEVEHTRLEEVSWPEESADLVLLSQIIEHIPDPTDLLTRVRRLLRPGGVLIVETPNALTLEHLHRRRFLDAVPQLAKDMPELGRVRRYLTALRRPWSELDPPRHVRIYTAKGLVRLLRTMGFQSETVSHYIVRERPYYLLTEAELRKVAEEDRAARSRLRRKSYAAYLAYVALWLPAMSLLRWYCRWSGRGNGLVVYSVRAA